MHTLYYLGLIFVLGAFVQWLSMKLSLPKVVGYLLLGLVIGPHALGLIPQEFVDNSDFVIDLALSMVAVLLGANLKYNAIKDVGRQILVITALQAIFAFGVVCAGFYLFFPYFGFSFERTFIISLLFGGIAAATAPAATMAVVRELKAKGRFTTTLLGVVALDDAMSLVLFAAAVTMGSTMIHGGSFEWFFLMDSLGTVMLSSLIGVVGAILSSMLDKLFSHHKGMETIATLGIVFIVYSLNVLWGLEPLFSALIMGVVMSNISDDFDLVEEEIDEHLQEVIFLLFFILSAMHLDISLIVSMPFVLLTYVLLRLFGKVFGSYIGARLSGADKNVQRYLGLGLFPQAGLAIGLALSLQSHPGFERESLFILNVVIATTIIHELIGPLLTRYILKKAGEAQA